MATQGFAFTSHPPQRPNTAQTLTASWKGRVPTTHTPVVSTVHEGRVVLVVRKGSVVWRVDGIVLGRAWRGSHHCSRRHETTRAQHWLQGGGARPHGLLGAIRRRDVLHHRCPVEGDGLVDTSENERLSSCCLLRVQDPFLTSFAQMTGEHFELAHGNQDERHPDRQQDGPEELGPFEVGEPLVFDPAHDGERHPHQSQEDAREEQGGPCLVVIGHLDVRGTGRVGSDGEHVEGEVLQAAAARLRHPPAWKGRGL